MAQLRIKQSSEKPLPPQFTLFYQGSFKVEGSASFSKYPDSTSGGMNYSYGGYIGIGGYRGSSSSNYNIGAFGTFTLQKAFPKNKYTKMTVNIYIYGSRPSDGDDYFSFRFYKNGSTIGNGGAYYANVIGGGVKTLSFNIPYIQNGFDKIYIDNMAKTHSYACYTVCYNIVLS